MIKIIGVYRIKCLADEKVYIGQSTNIKQRWKDHIIRLKENKHDNKYLQRAWNKYGPDSFVFSVLEECPKDFEGLNGREVFWINHFHALNRNYGFNLASGGGNGYSLSGMSESERREVYRKIGETRRRKYSGENSPNYGKPMSEEQKLKISRKLSGMGSFFYGKKRPEHAKKMKGGKNPRAKPVICINTSMIFECAKDAERYANTTNSNILKCCKGEQAYAGKSSSGEKLYWAYEPIRRLDTAVVKGGGKS